MRCDIINAKKIWRCFLVSFTLLLISFSQQTITYGATAGYTDHEHVWSNSTRCTVCRCTECKGKGYQLYSVATYAPDWVPVDCYDYKYRGCENCGGSGYNGSYYHEYWTRDTDVLYTTSYDSGYKAGSGNLPSGCTTCNGYGTVYKCTKSGCKYSSYGNWKTMPGYSSVCYQTANTYTISYRANGGTGSTSNNTAIYNANFLTTKNGYYRTGYTFTGWNEKSDGTGTAWNLNSAGVYESGNSWKWTYTSDITLYAQWEHNEYKVTYDANGGTTIASAEVYHYGDAVNLSPTAEKEGKIFVGWNTDPNATTPLSALAMPDLATSDNADYSDWELTLYAIYSIPVSDVANHTYPDYNLEKAQEVFLRIWEYGNASNYIDYPLTYESDTNTMVYRYTIDVDVSDFTGSMTTYCYAVYAFDNAGNWSVILEDTIYPPKEDEPPPRPIPDPKPEIYLQTVNHYRYDVILKDWVKFDVTTEFVEAGKTYTPAHITPPAGYEKTDIIYPEGYEISSEGSYVVKEAAITSAYYMPIAYTLTFNPNGGSCDTKAKSISYGDYYGALPTPTRKGWSYTGWYTAASGGNTISSSDRYLTAGSTTIYAQWTRNVHTVTYDYWTNGGTNVSVAGKDVGFDLAVDLTPKAEKTGNGLNGWTFVGWNTDPDATTALSSYIMPDTEVVLYAIYKKDIKLTIVEQTDSGQTTRSLSKTIYNNELDASFAMTETNKWTGWMLLGWTTETGAEEYPIVGKGNNFKISENATIYGLYTSTVTLGYDTNGSAMKLDDQIKEAFCNASGDYSYPAFVIAGVPILSDHSFVEWIDSEGNDYTPGSIVTFDKDTLLTASWDKYPEIEAYNRYFTLAQAQNGEITEAELLKKVVGTDKEDGTLVNGRDVIVKNYNASIFTRITADKEVEITYQATDSFGNTVTKTITITVTDTTAKKSTTKKYVRFIGSQFFADNSGDLVPSAQGGLEDTSIWRINANYRALLQETLGNTKTNVEKKTVSAFGSEWKIEVAGSGEWNKKEETWVFKQEDIHEMKRYTDKYGYVLQSIDKFLELFDDCRKKIK